MPWCVGRLAGARRSHYKPNQAIPWTQIQQERTPVFPQNLSQTLPQRRHPRPRLLLKLLPKRLPQHLRLSKNTSFLEHDPLTRIVSAGRLMSPLNFAWLLNFAIVLVRNNEYIIELTEEPLLTACFLSFRTTQQSQDTRMSALNACS